MPRNNNTVESDGSRLIRHLQERAAYPGAAPGAYPEVRDVRGQRTGPQSHPGSSMWRIRGRACETRMMSGPVWVPVPVLSLSGWPQTSVFTLWTSVSPPWSCGCWNASGRSRAVPLQGTGSVGRCPTWDMVLAQHPKNLGQHNDPGDTPWDRALSSMVSRFKVKPL